MNIALFIHGRGRGHASRARSINSALRDSGKHVHILAGEDAYDVLSDSQDVHHIESNLPGSGIDLFWRRFWNDRRFLKQKEIKLVISDGDAPSTWAARSLGIRVISIGHALIFPYCEHPFPLPQEGRKIEMFKSRVASQFADLKLAVHFVPIRSKKSDTVVVRPDFERVDQSSSDNYLVSYFRDGNGAALVLKIADRGFTIYNFGKEIECSNVKNYKSGDSNFRKLFQNCKGVIASAGSNLIYESIMCSKPLLLIHRKGDFEQASNIQYVEYMKRGYGMQVDQLSDQKINAFFEMLDTRLEIPEELLTMPTLTEALVDHI